MRPTRTLKLLAVAAMSASLITLSACGAGSRTGANTATQVACDFENPSEADHGQRARLQLLGRRPVHQHDGEELHPRQRHRQARPDRLRRPGAEDDGDARRATRAPTTSWRPTASSSAPTPPTRSCGRSTTCIAKYSAEYELDELDKAMLEGMSYEGKLYGAADAGPDVRHGLPQGHLREERPDPADDPRRDGRRGEEDPGRRRHEVPDRPAVARDRRHLDPVPGA